MSSQIPAVDWIIQFDPPDDPRDYIHRVGRTARGSNGKGRSLMFLQPSEVGFLKHLKEARVPLVEFEFPTKRIFNIQSQLEKLIGQNYYLNKVRLSVPNHCAGRYFTNAFHSSQRKMATARTYKHTHLTVFDQYLMCISSILSKSPKASVFRLPLGLTLRWGRA